MQNFVFVRLTGFVNNEYRVFRQNGNYLFVIKKPVEKTRKKQTNNNNKIKSEESFCYLK